MEPVPPGILHFDYDSSSGEHRCPNFFFAGRTEGRDQERIRMSDQAAQQHDEALAPERVFVGISVTRETVEVGISSLSVILGYRNETFGIESLTDAIAGLAPARIVLESSGGAEFEAACSLQAARLAVAVAYPHQARDFLAGAVEIPLERKGARARLLTELARQFDQHPSCARLVEPLADPQLQSLQALVQRRRQLARTLIAEYQLLTCSQANVRGGIEQTIAFLENQIGVIDRYCARHVSAQRAELARAMARAKRPGRGAPGMGAAEFMRAWRAK
ncbi:hypothetical protein QZM81_33840 [Burkholderia cepacia]|uniref:hypothetical protein n=1 Tax=Burkholderia cepacia TaxID=292 RepID=UPI00264E9A5B|nr:hypothetical protein [Burkholderia cepacia]MDN7860800.1 hypothetical protein [Burkholderia cepacia]